MCTGGTTSKPDICTELCGDGYHTTSKFQCDDGNIRNGDGCSSTCTVEAGFTCDGGTPNTRDVCIDKCGDGKVYNRP